MRKKSRLPYACGRLYLPACVCTILIDSTKKALTIVRESQIEVVHFVLMKHTYTTLLPKWIAYSLLSHSPIHHYHHRLFTILSLIVIHTHTHTDTSSLSLSLTFLSQLCACLLIAFFLPTFLFLLLFLLATIQILREAYN